MRRLAIIIAILTFIAAGNTSSDIIDGIAAIVNDEIITQSDLEERLKPYLRYISENFDEEEKQKRIAKIRRDALNELIKEKLLLLEAKEKGLTVSEEEIENDIAHLKKRLGGKKDFEELLAEQNVTEEKFRKRLAEQLLLRKLIDIELRGKIQIPSKSEVKAFYEKNKQNYREPDKIAISEIAVKVEGETKWLEAGKKTEYIRERILEGEDFAAMARKYSDAPSASRGGKLGFVSRAELLPEFENAISTLKVGEISKIIKTRIGFHLIKLESRKQARQKEFPEVRQQIENQLYGLRIEEALNKRVKKLAEKAYIKVISYE